MIDSVIVATVLASGQHARITATRRPRANRADVKCSASTPAVAERMLQVVRLARLTEAGPDSRDQVVLSMDGQAMANERDWELAAVLADRMVRGQLAPRQQLCANGWSDAWHLGQVAGHDLAPGGDGAGMLLGGARPATACAQAVYLSHLDGLNGHPDPAAAVSTARAWFPLYSGGVADTLCWVEVSVFPVGHDADEDAVQVAGADAALQLAVRQVLAGARHFDRCPPGRWRTAVRFEQTRFHGNSFELALVMADRMARGREFLARGRLIASGCSAAWHAGRVDTVDACQAKTALIAREAGMGDRVLLPGPWASELAPEFGQALRSQGASFACIDRIGII